MTRRKLPGSCARGRTHSTVSGGGETRQEASRPAHAPPLTPSSNPQTDTPPLDHTQDVATFLAWAAEPEADDRKLMGTKWMAVLALVFVTAVYYKRWKWAPLKSRRIVVDTVN
jgi:cytochrome c1